MSGRLSTRVSLVFIALAIAPLFTACQKQEGNPNAAVQKTMRQAKTRPTRPALTIRMPDGKETQLKREDLARLLTPKFQVPSNPVKKGISFEDLFSELKLTPAPTDELVFNGRKGPYPYQKAVKEEFGLVLNRKGMVKVVARNSEERIHIPHVRTIEIVPKTGS